MHFETQPLLVVIDFVATKDTGFPSKAGPKEMQTDSQWNQKNQIQIHKRNGQ
jgi:hypothetical protein